VQHLLNTQFPAFFPVCIKFTVAAEVATEDTDICWLNMKITVEKNFIAMQFFFDGIGQATCKTKTCFFE